MNRGTDKAFSVELISTMSCSKSALKAGSSAQPEVLSPQNMGIQSRRVYWRFSDRKEYEIWTDGLSRMATESDSEIACYFNVDLVLSVKIPVKP